jgi:hypothetical protein
VLRMLVIFDMPVLELVQGRVRREAVVCPTGLEGLGVRKLLFFHYQFPRDLLGLDLVVQEVSTVLGLGWDSCILKLCMRRITSR